MMLSACSNSLAIPEFNPVCEGLRGALQSHVDELLTHQGDIPTDVLVTGSKLVAGFEAGCPDE